VADSAFVLARGFDAAAAVVKHRAVKLTTAENTVTPITGPTDIAVGIAEFDCTAADILKGKGVNVQHIGIAQMEAGEAITVGQLVTCDTVGRAVVAASAERLVGLCVGNPAGASGERISILLSLPGTILV
jgi:hypothetical protein